ncbi:stress response protein SCP2 [Paenibacillus baekrokdamisoli]|uniref:Stress response protein SCP2 n=1 Tax=Paenibacillus baekrokdamisoli TaxID=1712516 RepID=A0A3G9JD70_9BACL|nr:TerD family protein [Paenibacillus baekrokdamisoli]MBB3068052.1 stress response protein SCP2 [Paenibacillus baekrokdamisoli]BBH22903.1 stress response protein SCP2 [Paenibacillus baekrokdamisoli]
MSTINLVKGQKIDLTKGNAGLTKVIVGLGWDPVKQSRGFFGGKKQANIDCDASALLLNENGKLTDVKNLVCFHNKTSLYNAVVHSGDNVTGEGEGDDEQIEIDLVKVPQDVSKILVVVNIYDCINRKQDFGMIQSAYIRVLNGSNSNELIKFNLSDNYAGKTALICGELYRHGGEWKFAAIGEGTQAAHINQLAEQYK